MTLEKINYKGQIKDPKLEEDCEPLDQSDAKVLTEINISIYENNIDESNCPPAVIVVTAEGLNKSSYSLFIYFYLNIYEQALNSIYVSLYRIYILYRYMVNLNLGNTNNYKEYRKVQGLVGESSFSIVIPKSFMNALGIGKGDFVRVYTEEEKIIVEKAR